MTELLQGIRVLDFGRYIAGPYCAALLAEYGAEVIRIEKREGSEDRFVAPIGAGGEGSLFLQMNRNKLSLTVDPMSAEGREIVRKLVRTADVVVANLPDQSLAAMGLDFASLCASKPDIIATTSSAFGSNGPMARNVGFDGVGQAMSGAVFMTGEPDQPYRAQVNWVDFGTALHCAFGTMAALMERRRRFGPNGERIRRGAVGAERCGATDGRRAKNVPSVPQRGGSKRTPPYRWSATANVWLRTQACESP